MIKFFQSTFSGFIEKKPVEVTFILPVVTQPKAHRRKRMSHRRFWMVWCSTGITPPKIRYSRESLAEQAAENMARRFPTKKFYVMQSKTRYVAYEVGGEMTREKW